MELGYVCRPKVGELVCGDGVAIIEGENDVLLAVIDGLGHGPDALFATQHAQAFFARQSTGPLPELLRACDRELRKTPGVALAVLRIHLQENTFEHAAIGNVEALCPSNPNVQMISFPGIVGGGISKVKVSTHPIERGDVLLLYTDGVRRSLRVDRWLRQPAQELAQQVVECFGKEHDDATCLVVSY